MHVRCVLVISVGTKILSIDISPKYNLGISHLIGHGELEEIQSVGIPLCNNMPMGTKRRGSCINQTKRCNNPSESICPSRRSASIWQGNDQTILLKMRHLGNTQDLNLYHDLQTVGKHKIKWENVYRTKISTVGITFKAFFSSLRYYEKILI